MTKTRLVILTAVVSMLVTVPTAVLASHQFRDVSDSNLHHDAISWLASQGVTGGCTADGEFYCPDEPVTRAQMATFLRRFSNSQGSGGDTTSSALPSGVIVMMPTGQSCPSGFAGVPSLNDGRFPRGSRLSGSGGTTSHTHRHPHSHSVNIATDYGFTSGFGGGFGAPQYVEDSSGSFHNHQVTGTTDGVSSFEENTDSADHLPPYYNVTFCSKN